MNWQRCGQRGVVTVEFIFTFPAFIVLMLLVLETGFMWIDKHVMKLAAFEAARTVLATTDARGLHYGDGSDAEVGENPKSLCWRQDVTKQTALDRNLIKAVKLAAVKKIALIAPTPDYFLGGLGIDDKALKDAVPALNKGAYSNSAGLLYRALKRNLLGIPAAWALTSPSCRMDEDDGSVRIKLTYHRPARMPYVGSIFWALHAIRIMNKSLTDAHAQDVMQLKLDPLLYHDIVAVSPAITKLKSDADAIKQQAQTVVSRAQEAQDKISALADMAEAVPALSALVTPDFKDKLHNRMANLGEVRDGINKVDTASLVDEAAAPLSKALVQTAAATTTAIYALPESFRLVPMIVEVRLMPLGNDILHGDSEWQESKALAVMPLTKLSGHDKTAIYAAYVRELASRHIAKVAPSGEEPGLEMEARDLVPLP